MSKHTLLASIALFGAVLGPSLCLGTNAMADVERVVVTTANEIGPFRGIRYREIIGMMEGTAPGGAYSVPVTIAFPIAAEDYNGIAVVDVPNSGTVDNTDWPIAGVIYPLSRVHIGDDYMFGNGYFFITAHWDKEAADFLGNATIAEAADAYEIIRDSAAIARDPTLAELPAEIAPPRGADQLIAFGYSQSASIVLGWIHQNRNTAEGAPTFDGALLGGAQGRNCANLELGQNQRCTEPVTDGAKVILITSEGDAQRAGFERRGETDDYRLYEVAGVSHLPATLHDFRQAGLPTQNPVNATPVYRAALHNLQQWLEGTVPPPSIYITMAEGPAGRLGNGPYRDAVRDADGNALGGVRLPHMPNGPGIGAPLGAYAGLDRAWGAFFLFSGKFVPFSPEEIIARYPGRTAYVNAVAAAADALVADRYILQEDADAYIAAAQAAQFWFHDTGATIDPALPANFGEATLAAGFAPDPHTVEVQAGGVVVVDFAALGPDCVGYLAAAPSYTLFYTADGGQSLTIAVNSPADTTLIVKDPNDEWVCADETVGHNPAITFDSPPPTGRYDIWVAAFDPEPNLPATLRVTGLGVGP